MGQRDDTAGHESDRKPQLSRAEELRSVLAEMNTDLDRLWLLHAVLDYLRSMEALGVKLCIDIDQPKYAAVSARLLADIKRRTGINVNLRELFDRELGADPTPEELAAQEANADMTVTALIDDVWPDAKQATLLLFKQFRWAEAFAETEIDEPGWDEAAAGVEPLRKRIDAMVECFFSEKPPRSPTT